MYPLYIFKILLIAGMIIKHWTTLNGQTGVENKITIVHHTVSLCMSSISILRETAEFTVTVNINNMKHLSKMEKRKK